MGGWGFVRERFEKLLSGGAKMRYVGRGPSASPATGSYSIHQKEQAELVAEALGIGIDDAKDSITSDAARTAPPQQITS
jgi:2-oxoglutarate dehydrogenase E1 component